MPQWPLLLLMGAHGAGGPSVPPLNRALLPCPVRVFVSHLRALWNLAWCSFGVVRAATIIHCMNACEKGALCRLVWV